MLDVVEAEAALFARRRRARRRRAAAPARALRLARPLAAFAAAPRSRSASLLGALVIAPGGARDAAWSRRRSRRRRAGARARAPGRRRCARRGTQRRARRQPACRRRPPGKVYEVWVERGGRARCRPTRSSTPTAAGEATVAVPVEPARRAAVLVTAERLGGARVPTMAPLITRLAGLTSASW